MLLIRVVSIFDALIDGSSRDLFITMDVDEKDAEILFPSFPDCCSEWPGTVTLLWKSEHF